jgi:DNA-binding beta-propeller fold protein YncE
MGLTASSDAVWVASNAGNKVVRIDPRTNKVVDSIGLGHFMPCGYIVADRSAVWSAGAVCTGAVVRTDRARK